MNIYYENHMLERFNLNQNVFRLINVDDLFNIEYETNTSKGFITSITRKFKSIELEFDILNKNGIDWKQTYTSLMNVIEKDIAQGYYGRLWVNGYYIDCNVDVTKLKKVNLKNIYTNGTLRIVSNFLWKKKYNTSFKLGGAQPSNVCPKQYPYRYPYHYLKRVGKGIINNPSFNDSFFEIHIFGPVNNPSITVNNNEYLVNTNIAENEILTIDYSSEETRTIVKRDINNTYSINCFNDRSKDGMFFKKIKGGVSEVLWDGTFSFEINLFEERNHPRWI